MRMPRTTALTAWARGLDRLSRFAFAVRLSPVTRSFFERAARIQTGQTARDVQALASAPTRTPPRWRAWRRPR
jgi:hypothetical protein